MSSSPSQEEIKKIKSIKDKRTGIVLGTGVAYAIIAHFISNLSYISPIFLPLTIGIGTGLLMVGFSIVLNYETNKKLILMEKNLESKLEEISNKVATQISIDAIQNKVDEHYFHTQLLELKNELEEIKKEIRRKK